MKRLAALVVAAVIVMTPAAGARPQHRAGVLVRDGEGRLHRMCVFFDTKTTTGLGVLRKAGYDVQLNPSSIGTAVCKIGGDGCSSGNCFCHYPKFWGYWTRDTDKTKWKFSDVGAQARVVRDGALDAWVWGKDGGPAPPQDVTFNDVCALGATEERRTQPAAKKTNYVAFAAFAAAFVVAGLLLARRRATPRP